MIPYGVVSRFEYAESEHLLSSTIAANFLKTSTYQGRSYVWISNGSSVLRLTKDGKHEFYFSLSNIGQIKDILPLADNSLIVLSDIEDFNLGSLIFVTKLDVNGNIMWSKKIVADQTNPGTIYFSLAQAYWLQQTTRESRLAADSQGNIYVGAFVNDYNVSYNKQAVIFKLSSSGVMLSTKILSKSISNMDSNFISLAIDPTDPDNVIVGTDGFYTFQQNMGGVTTTETRSTVALCKISSSFAISWQKQYRFNISGIQDNFLQSVVISPVDKSIIVSSIGSSVSGIAKYNSSGVIQWSRVVSEQYNFNTPYYTAIDVDSANNIMVTNGEYVIKLSGSNGSKLFSRYMSYGGYNPQAGNGKFLNNNFVISGKDLAVLPGDGSKSNRMIYVQGLNSDAGGAYYSGEYNMLSGSYGVTESSTSMVAFANYSGYTISDAIGVSRSNLVMSNTARGYIT